MILKILDRYVVRSYLFAYVVVFVSLVMMVVLFDFVLSIDEFFRDFAKTDDDGNPLGPQTITAVVADITGYYLVHTTHYFSLLSGFIGVIAAGFVLARMTYTNEMTAVLASGVSLHRVMRPIVVVGGLLNLLLAVDQELLMPSLRDRLMLDRDDQAGRRAFEVWGFRDAANSLVNVESFNPADGCMYGVLIVERDRPADTFTEGVTGRARSLIRAAKATWEPDPNAPLPQATTTSAGWFDWLAQANSGVAGLDNRPGRWRLEKAIRIRRDGAFGRDEDVAAILAADDPTSITGELGVAVYPVDPAATTDMSPARLRQHQYAKFLDFLSYNELGELAVQPQISNAMRAELQVRRHTRVTGPLTNMLLLVAAVPFFLTRERTNLIISSIMAMALVGGGMGLSFMASQWAFEQNDPVWYLVGAWVPVAIFAPLAVLSVEAIRT